MRETDQNKWNETKRTKLNSTERSYVFDSYFEFHCKRYMDTSHSSVSTFLFTTVTWCSHNKYFDACSRRQNALNNFIVDDMCYGQAIGADVLVLLLCLCLSLCVCVCYCTSSMRECVCVNCIVQSAIRAKPSFTYHTRQNTVTLCALVSHFQDEKRKSIRQLFFFLHRQFQQFNN